MLWIGIALIYIVFPAHHHPFVEICALHCHSTTLTVLLVALCLGRHSFGGLVVLKLMEALDKESEAADGGATTAESAVMLTNKNTRLLTSSIHTLSVSFR